jgi:hypothetical protein
VDITIGLGDPAAEVLQLAIDLEADLVIVGTHERSGLGRFALGPVSSEVFRQARCSVLVARPSDYEGTEKTLAIMPAAEATGAEARPIRPSPVVRYRSRPFSTYDANIIPTGIPRDQVR